MSVVTRFAPSPTGMLHIGGARTALFNYLFSKNQKGKFLLRIEDTDKERSTNEAIEVILNGLKWLGIEHDGEAVIQSLNAKRHAEIAYKLLELGKAYYCYTSKEELEEMRENAKNKGEVFKFRSPWRENINKPANPAIKPVIRIKVPLEGETVIDDLIQGKIAVKNSEIDDFVILRGDESATYMLAVVVDDNDMKVTHIIRGDDHLTNTFKQKIIYEALDWNIPKFAHIPLIYGADGAKMSKRHGATSVLEYKNLGYLPAALRNYLLRLGWSFKDEEIISDEDAIKWFNIEKVGKSPSRFDFAKLNFLNKHYIKNSNEEDLLKMIMNLADYDLNNYLNQNLVDKKKKIKKVINFSKEKAENLIDLKNYLKIFIDNTKPDNNIELITMVNEKKNLLIEFFNDLYLVNFDIENIKKYIEDFFEKKSIKIKDLGPQIRVILTYSKSSYGNIPSIIEALGKDEIKKRVSYYIS